MVHFSTCRARGDRRRRDLQYASMHSAWDAQLPSLADAFLLWKHPPVTVPKEPQEQMGHVFHVTHVDVFGMFFCSTACYNLNQPMVDSDPRFEVIQQDNELANVSLIRNGLLGCTPTSPELAITLQCLELYHQLQRRQSSFGIQAYTKVLCVLHGVSGFKSYVVAADC